MLRKLPLLGAGAMGVLLATWQVVVPALLVPDQVKPPELITSVMLAAAAMAMAMLYIALRGRQPTGTTHPIEASWAVVIGAAAAGALAYGPLGTPSPYAAMTAVGFGIVLGPAVGAAVLRLLPSPGTRVTALRLPAILGVLVSLVGLGGWCIFLPVVVVHADPGPARPEFVTVITALGAGAILIAATLAWLLARNVSRDLRQLREAVRLLDAPPEVAPRVPVMLHDELADLARAVVALRGRLWRELGEYDEALRRSRGADTAREELLRVVSHELRTPLAAICGYSQLLLEGMDGPLSTEAADDVQSILDSGRQLSALVDDVLDVAMLSSGRPGLKLDAVDVGALISEVVRTHESLIRGRPLTLDVDIAPDLPRLSGDRKRLRQVVTNLLANAIKFTDQGSVRLSARLAGNVVEVEIVDTGVGISEAELPGLFDEYKQGSNADSRRRKGAGLGLAICRRLVELHGGVITASSRPGEGSRFVFTLPADSPTAVAAGAAPPTGAVRS